jgi:hypothetical protein
LETLAHPLCGVMLGVTTSLLYTLLRTENPARIPFSKLIIRSLFGIGLYLFTWLIFSYILYLLAVLTYSWVGGLDGVGLFFLACVVGLCVPLAVRVGKNRLLDREAAKNYRLVADVMQFLDEITGQYFGRIIMREERKASYDVMKPDHDRATLVIDRLFEFHLEGIESESANELEPEERAMVFNFERIRSTAIKFKLLLRHLGYNDCMARIEEVKKDPKIILPNWLPEMGQRRCGSDRRQTTQLHASERRTLIIHGRRKLDAPETRALILMREGRALPPSLPPKALSDSELSG